MPILRYRYRYLFDSVLPLPFGIPQKIPEIQYAMTAAVLDGVFVTFFAVLKAAGRLGTIVSRFLGLKPSL